MAVAERFAERDLARLDRLIAEQERMFLARQPRSTELAARAAGALAGGVTSNWQISRPQPVWISHGRGSKVWDVDGNELVDLHNGYGVMAVGHAHPAVGRAVQGRVTQGAHFAQPPQDALAGGENLARRVGLPPWRVDHPPAECPR